MWTLRTLQCVLRPPFHHDWKIVENIDQDRESPFVVGVAWADPTQRTFREYHMRCARCGKETWARHSAAPMWVRYLR
jgi:hypothetical protein